MRNGSMGNGQAIAHLWLATLTVVVATSYLTLLVLAVDQAERLAPWYGGLMFALALANLVCYVGGRRWRRSRG